MNNPVMDSETIAIRFSHSGIATGKESLRTFTVEILSHCLESEGFAPSETELSVLFCSRRKIHELNLEFRQLDEPTDVLSFPSGEDLSELSAQGGYLGDLALSLEICAIHAQEYSVPLPVESASMIVHGFLHLCGWDHDTPARDQKMRDRTELLLAQSGITLPQFTIKP